MITLAASLLSLAIAAIPGGSNSKPSQESIQKLETELDAAETDATDSYELALNYSIQDQHFGVPSFTLKEGEETSLVKAAGGKRYYLDMFAENNESDRKAGNLRMVFVSGVLNPNGSKSEVSRTALVAKLGKTSRASVASDEGKSETSIAVTARKKE